jgi:glycerol kinase
MVRGLDITKQRGTTIVWYLKTRRAEFHGLSPWVNEKVAI